MHAQDYLNEMTEILRRRGDVTVDLHPLLYQAGSFAFLRAASAEIEAEDKILLIAAGVHGDEISGPLTLLRYADKIFARAHAAGLKVIMYPLRNPSGFEEGARYNVDGDKGDAGNNDFLRYVLADGGVTDDLSDGDLFASWGWSSEERFGVRLAAETRLMHELIRKDPLSQIVACIDLHQDLITPTPSAAAYFYAFGDLSRYTEIVVRVHGIVPVLANTPISAGEASALPTDVNGFIVRHDGSLPDLLWRMGTSHAVTTETTGATTLEDAVAVNMVWIDGLIALCALRHE